MGDRYDLVVSPVPEPRRPLSPLMKALVTVAREHPGEEVRIAKHTSADSARVAVYKLQTGDRAWRRPPGTWEFFHGAILDKDEVPTGEYGVWAKFTPPENTATTD